MYCIQGAGTSVIRLGSTCKSDDDGSSPPPPKLRRPPAASAAGATVNGRKSSSISETRPRPPSAVCLSWLAAADPRCWLLAARRGVVVLCPVFRCWMLDGYWSARFSFPRFSSSGVCCSTENSLFSVFFRVSGFPGFRISGFQGFLVSGFPGCYRRVGFPGSCFCVFVSPIYMLWWCWGALMVFQTYTHDGQYAYYC